MFSLVSLQNYLFLNFLNKKKIRYNFLGELYITLEIVFVILPACTRWFCKLNDKDAEGSSSFNSLWPLELLQQKSGGRFQEQHAAVV